MKAVRALRIFEVEEALVRRILSRQIQTIRPRIRQKICHLREKKGDLWLLAQACAVAS